jgi:enoyl-CoA hydratase
MSDQPLVLHQIDGAVATLTLNRPEQRNALSPALLDELGALIEQLDADGAVRCVVLTGGPTIFAAGSDIKVMVERTPTTMLEGRNYRRWERIRSGRCPLIAAVSGYALGGGCELAMLCDLIVASETARFGQPEIMVGVMPGAGGTQRLARAIGPYRAMELVLTGRTLDAQEALALGLVNRVAPVASFLEVAQSLAAEIAARAPIAVQLAREALRHGVENTVREGLEVERRNFYLLFDTDDQTEGMRAFLEKRPPHYKGS